MKNLCKSFSSGSSKSGAAPRGKTSQEPRVTTTQARHQPGHSPTVPEQGRLVTACSISCPVTIRQGEITSWVQGPSRKFSQKQQEAGLEVRLWIVLGSSRKFSQQVRITGDRAVPSPTYNIAQAKTEDLDLPELKWSSWTGGQSVGRSPR